MSQPKHLVVMLGAVQGPAYRIEAFELGLIYQPLGQGLVPMTGEILMVSEADWDAFHEALESIGVWEWNSVYHANDASGGEAWTFECEWDGQTVMSKGYGAYPTGFERLLRAVKVLIGGREFK